MLTPIRASDSIELPFAPEAVWRVLENVRNYPDWWPASLHLRITAEGEGPLGTEFEICPPGGRPFRCLVESLEPPRSIRMRYNVDFIQGHGQWRLEPLASGTRVTYELDVAARDLLVAVLARFMNLPEAHSKEMRLVLRNLGTRLQTGPTRP